MGHAGTALGMLLAATTGRVCALRHCASALGMPWCCWLPEAKSLAGGQLRKFGLCCAVSCSSHKKKRHLWLLTNFPYFPATYFYFREVNSNPNVHVVHYSSTACVLARIPDIRDIPSRSLLSGSKFSTVGSCRQL